MRFSLRLCPHVLVAICTMIPTMGCGAQASMNSRTAPDAGTDAPVNAATVDAGDAGDAGDAAQDAGAPETGMADPCDAGGYFVLVGNDAGSQVLRDGCQGFLVPSLFAGLCGEDCLCSHVVGCSDASALDLALSSNVCGTVQEAGTYPIHNSSWTNGGTTTATSSGWIRLATFPPSPGPVAGDYSLTFLPADGGPGDTIGGTFCVQQ